MGTVHTFPHDDNATPTTRFLRNCDAVGLFNDLPPNPFEETFRLATASSTDLSHILKDSPSKESTEETLNTPRVISTAANQSCSTINNDDEDVVILSDFLEPILPNMDSITNSQHSISSNDSSDVEIIENSSETISSFTKSVPVSNMNSNNSLENIIFAINEDIRNGHVEGFLLDPSTSQPASNSVSVNLNVNKEFTSQKSFPEKVKKNTASTAASNIIHTNMSFKPTNPINSSNIIYKLSGTNLPAILNGKNVVILPSRTVSKNVEANFPRLTMKSNVINQTQNTDSNVKQKLSNFLRNNSSHNVNPVPVEESSENSKDSNSVSSIEEEKKEYSRERNRMAQKRCRMKKKRFIMQLRNETATVLNKNQKLETELLSLRAEIAHLKTLLLAHRNCSVTRAMYKADLNAIMNNEVSEIVEDIEIAASDDTDDVPSSPVQITYRSQYNQVHNQQVNQVNHFHVHVPPSPEAGAVPTPASAPETFLNFAPDPRHMSNKSLGVSRHLNILNSKYNPNKKLICDSKKVPIKANDQQTSNRKSAPTNLTQHAAHAVAASGHYNPVARRPTLKIFINGNETSLSKAVGCNTSTNSSSSSSSSNSSSSSSSGSGSSSGSLSSGISSH